MSDLFVVVVPASLEALKKAHVAGLHPVPCTLRSTGWNSAGRQEISLDEMVSVGMSLDQASQLASQYAAVTGHLARVEPHRVDLDPDPLTAVAVEVAFARGSERAYVEMLSFGCISLNIQPLPVDGPAAARIATLEAQAMETRSALREACELTGIDHFSEELTPAAVINGHLIPYLRKVEHTELATLPPYELKQKLAQHVYDDLLCLDALVDAGRLPPGVRERAVRLMMCFIDSRWLEQPLPVDEREQVAMRSLSPRDFAVKGRAWPSTERLRPTMLWNKDDLAFQGVIAKEARSWTLADAQREVSNRLFVGVRRDRVGSLWLIERLADRRRLLGHGNHAMQNAAEIVGALVELEWLDKETRDHAKQSTA